MIPSRPGASAVRRYLFRTRSVTCCCIEKKQPGVYTTLCSSHEKRPSSVCAPRWRHMMAIFTSARKKILAKYHRDTSGAEGSSKEKSTNRFLLPIAAAHGFQRGECLMPMHLLN